MKNFTPLVNGQSHTHAISIQPPKMAERLYATSSQHIELAQYICYLLNDSRRHPISTSTRIYLLDLLIDLRPSSENRHHRLDLRTFHVLRRTLWEISEG